MSLNVNNLPLREAALALARDYLVNIVVTDAVADKPVTLFINRVTMTTAADMLARAASTMATYGESTWCIGPLREGERGHLVAVPRRGSATDTANLLSTLLTSTGKIATTPGGVLVMADTQDNLIRASKLLSMIESQPGELLWTKVDIVSMDAANATDARVNFDAAAGVALTMIAPYWQPSGGVTISGQAKRLATRASATRTSAWIAPPGYPLSEKAIDSLLLPETEVSTATPTRTTRFVAYDASSELSITVAADGPRWNVRGEIIARTPTTAGNTIRIRGNSITINATIESDVPTLIAASTVVTEDSTLSDGLNFARSSSNAVKWIYVFATISKL